MKINSLNRKADTMTEATLNQQIAETILEQIKATNKWALASWGAKDFINADGALWFSARGSNGRYIKIMVTLTPADLYHVQTGKLNRKTLEFKHMADVDGVYGDQLVDVIDGMVK